MKDLLTPQAQFARSWMSSK